MWEVSARVSVETTCIPTGNALAWFSTSTHNDATTLDRTTLALHTHACACYQDVDETETEVPHRGGRLQRAFIASQGAGHATMDRARAELRAALTDVTRKKMGFKLRAKAGGGQQRAHLVKAVALLQKDEVLDLAPVPLANMTRYFIKHGVLASSRSGRSAGTARAATRNGDDSRDADEDMQGSGGSSDGSDGGDSGGGTGGNTASADGGGSGQGEASAGSGDSASTGRPASVHEVVRALVHSANAHHDRSDTDSAKAAVRQALAAEHAAHAVLRDKGHALVLEVLEDISRSSARSAEERGQLQHAMKAAGTWFDHDTVVAGAGKAVVDTLVVVIEAAQVVGEHSVHASGLQTLALVHLLNGAWGTDDDVRYAVACSEACKGELVGTGRLDDDTPPTVTQALLSVISVQGEAHEWAGNLERALELHTAGLDVAKQFHQAAVHECMQKVARVRGDCSAAGTAATRTVAQQQDAGQPVAGADAAGSNVDMGVAADGAVGGAIGAGAAAGPDAQADSTDDGGDMEHADGGEGGGGGTGGGAASTASDSGSHGESVGANSANAGASLDDDYQRVDENT